LKPVYANPSEELESLAKYNELLETVKKIEQDTEIFDCINDIKESVNQNLVNLSNGIFYPEDSEENEN